ncbi:MAG: tRNA 2-thiocytidine(32) synthetase TtcA [Bacteroidales bacterium]|jgi:tRNA(Ile)-lysidine synthase TilS/MesJ|nr:tRNA 2-thiocytidine(32) synthetase TtcA [Bacteroidales bacterium]
MLQPKSDQRFLEKFNRFFKKAVNIYQLIPRGSVVTVGLSGGKDSLALLDQLSDFHYRKQLNITIVAAHIQMENISYQANMDYLQNFCDERDVSFIVQKSAFDPENDRRKSPCFLCSWQRRKALFEIAKFHHSNIIALGHHQDDMIETLLMNMAFQGSIASMPPKLTMDKFDMNIIRPMALLTEADVKRYAAIKEFIPVTKNCPYEQSSFRLNIKNIIGQLETLNPKVRSSIYASMQNIKKDYLPKI